MTVSITIPCRNEEKYIEKCLQSIIDCNYPKENLEVFVCDGMSDDKTVEIIKTISLKHSFIQLIENQLQTTQFALNLGLKAADAEIKIILGAHAEIHPEYINECINAFNIDKNIGCVGGVLENVFEDETSQHISMAMSSSFGVGNAHFRTGEKSGYVDTVAFGAYKTEVFEKVGYFDEELTRNQDDEFNFRVIKGGFKIYLSQKIKAKYYVRASFKKLYRQYYQYGYWKVLVNKKHNTITTVRQLVPAFFVLYVTLGVFLSLLNKSICLLFSFGLLTYLFTATKFALKKSRSFKVLIKIIFTFLILHWSYGTGYLKGILHFLILNKSTASAKNIKLSR